MTVREEREELEKAALSEKATRAANSVGRLKEEPECEIRTCFQRDIDRISHSKAFRRLKHKTQVFLQPEGDHYRTRLTHTLEVARIARTISRALKLNEDLTEAIALGHDLGHTPFGHAGERAMSEIMKADGGFLHNEQSLRVVDAVEKEGRGLNLTAEVRDGILRHTGQQLPATLEGRVVRLSDRAAYTNHDMDDAIRAGLLTESDIPAEIICALGDSFSERTDTFVKSVIYTSAGLRELAPSPAVNFALDSFHSFLFKNVYSNMTAKSEETKVFGILKGIFGYYVDNSEKLPGEYLEISERDGLIRAVCDYVSGMTDKYAIYKYSELFVPEAWQFI